MKYYLAHIQGSDPIFENMKFIVYTFTKTVNVNVLSIGEVKLCLHQEIDVKVNTYNSERINICFDDNEYQYTVSRYHYENLETTLYDRIDENEPV